MIKKIGTKYSFTGISWSFSIAILVILWLLSKIALASNLIEGSAGSLLKMTPIAKFEAPWAMTFIDSELLLVTSKKGKLWLVSKSGEKLEISGVPKVKLGGQGGLGDIVLHPNFSSNSLIYLSYVEQPGIFSPRGAVVVRAKLELSKKPQLKNLQYIWAQIPKTGGSGHFSHRLVFGENGSEHERKLFITSGDRQLQIPAQQWDVNLGKIIRLNDDGSIPADNPFQDRGKLAKTFWTLGHRNSLGIAFDNNGRLWAHEMGPRHGDELNLIIRGKNYGWPIVSEGSHYNGTSISKHSERPEFYPPKMFWVPTIAPSGLFFYKGKEFPEWQGNAFIGGLRSKALIRVNFVSTVGEEKERFEWGNRVREVDLSEDGSIWVLEDPPGERLIKFSRP